MPFYLMFPFVILLICVFFSVLNIGLTLSKSDELNGKEAGKVLFDLVLHTLMGLLYAFSAYCLCHVNVAQ